MIATKILAHSLELRSLGATRNDAVWIAWKIQTFGMTDADRLLLADILGIRAIVC